jgi:regulator of protease activity HflC (stomatin/prohibitin superfamily)
MFWLAVLIAIAAIIIIAATIQINKQWEEAVILRLGKYNRTKGPGVFFRIPGIESVEKRDMREMALDIEKQEVITKDNISLKIDAVIFLKIINAMKSVVNVKDYENAIRKYSQATMRDVIGAKELDDVLVHRDRMAADIREIVDKVADGWGIDITRAQLQDIELPDEMKRAMAAQAEAERERRAVITKSEGELIASENLQKAAETLEKNPMAFRLRVLSMMANVSKDGNVIFLYPTEALDPKLLSISAGISQALQKKRGEQSE